MDFTVIDIDGICYLCGKTAKGKDTTDGFLCWECNDKEIDKMEQVKEVEHDTKLFELMNILPMYEQATFDSYIPNTHFQETAKNEMECNKGTFILYGGNGSGKTHLACAYLLKHKKGLFVFASRMFRQLRTNDDFNLYCRVPILVIDDFGKSNGSDHERGCLSEIINERQARFLTTIITTNYPPLKDKPNGYEGIILDDFIGNDVMSRLQQAFFLRVSGEDYRGRK